MCIYIHIHTSIYIHIYVYVYIYIYTYIYTYIPYGCAVKLAYECEGNRMRTAYHRDIGADEGYSNHCALHTLQSLCATHTKAIRGVCGGLHRHSIEQHAVLHRLLYARIHTPSITSSDAVVHCIFYARPHIREPAPHTQTCSGKR